MANDQSGTLGLRPIRQPGGNMEIMYFRANTSIDIFRWQPIAINNSGQAAVAAIGDLTQLLGTAVGFLDINNASLPSDMTDLNQAAYLQSGNDGLVAVTVDPNQLYILEADTGGGTLISTSEIGNTVAFTYLATTGSTTTGIANVVLDASDAAADSGGSFRIVGLSGNVNQDGTFNTSSANFVKAIVKINYYQFGPTGFAVGF